MFTFFLLLGRFGELNARYKASAFSANLYKATPSIATLLSGQQVATKSLSIGDVIVVRAGDIIPIDGELLKGITTCDESMLTGEFTGIKKNIGDRLFAGSINTSEFIELSVTTDHQNTWLSHILKWQEAAQNTKPKVIALTDTISHYFILIILLLSALTALIWWKLDPSQALWITISVLVATCPCALSLATPTAFTCATAKLSKLGILIKQAHVWDTLAKVDHCVLDKTGTLTHGKIQIESSKFLHHQWSLDQIYAIAFALEQNINHPIALAFQHLPQTQKIMIENIQHHESQGVSGWWQSQEWRLGNSVFVGIKTTHSKSGLWLTCDGIPVMRFTLADTFRPKTKEFVDEMEKRQWKHTVLTGDPSLSSHQILADFGFKSIKIGLFPQEKLQWVNRFAKKDIVMMIGDGMNDAPVLAGAHVSIALNHGTDLAKSSADAILLGENLTPILMACDLAKRCRRIVKQNFAWALAYNLCILPLAMMGMVPPYIAVLGMSFSSLLVVSNSLRLLK
jgi:Cu2+-exporting ATPase